MSGARRSRPSGRILVAAGMLATLAACSSGSHPGTSTGAAGTGGQCPAAPASYDCPAGSGDYACGIPQNARLTRFGDGVYLQVVDPSGAGRVLRVTTGGLTPFLTLAAGEALALIDDGYAYIARPKDGAVERRKLDSTDPPEPYLTCAGQFSATFFADEAAIYLNSTIGLLRIDKASTPTVNLARLHPWGYQFTFFDGAHFYGTPVTHIGTGDDARLGGPIVVGESTGAACTCDCTLPDVAELAVCTHDPTGTCGRTPTALAATSELIYPVVRGGDATSIFITTWPLAAGAPGNLLRVAKDGSKTTALLGFGSGHMTWSPGDALAVDGAFIYARISTPTGLRSIRMRTDGTDVTELGTSAADHAGRAYAIQVDAEGAYFLLSDEACTARLIRYAKPTDASDGGSDASDGGSDAGEVGGDASGDGNDDAGADASDDGTD